MTGEPGTQHIYQGAWMKLKQIMHCKQSFLNTHQNAFYDHTIVHSKRQWTILFPHF